MIESFAANALAAPMQQPPAPSIVSRDGTFRELTGLESENASLRLITQTCAAALPDRFPDKDAETSAVAAVISLLKEIAPRNAVEAMLVRQMIATDAAIADCYRRAMMAEENIERRSLYLSHAGKLTRSFTSMYDTLLRHRGKPSQRITVEHVHVHPGGQAVVGLVEQGGVGRDIERTST